MTQAEAKIVSVRLFNAGRSSLNGVRAIGGATASPGPGSQRNIR